VQAAGGVTALVGMAAKHADSGAVQAQFAGVLRDLCISDEIALEIHQAGGGAAPQPHPYPYPLPLPLTQALALALTVTLTHQAGGVAALLELARRHFHSVEVQAAAAGALRNLTEIDEIASAVASLGGVEVLVDAARQHESIEVHARVAGALWGLSVHDEIAERIGAPHALTTPRPRHSPLPLQPHCHPVPPPWPTPLATPCAPLPS